MKWVLRIGGAVVVVAIIGVVAGIFFINSLARAGIQQGVGYATDVQTNIGGVRLGIFGGTLSINEMQLGNPQGFDSERFLALRETDGSLKIGSLTGKTVEIPHLYLIGLDLTLERKDARENYKTILESLQRLSKKEEAEPDKEGKQLIIRDLQIKDIHVTLRGYPGMDGKRLQLGDIVLTDVGTGEHAVRTSQLAGIVIREVFRQMLQNPDMLPGALAAGLGEGLQGLSDFGAEGARFIGDMTEAGMGAVGDAADRARRAVDDAADEAGRAVEDAGDRIRGLIPGQRRSNDNDD
ncbi:MAG: hypothetical protein JJU36_07055 [Phycisphaeraceae bacterium]|nr:hypothetical protein [Phycisphaeraceae bacterium]